MRTRKKGFDPHGVEKKKESTFCVCAGGLTTCQLEERRNGKGRLFKKLKT